MRKTIEDRLKNLMEETEGAITEVELEIKVKTADGMVYTADSCPIAVEKDSVIPFSDVMVSEALDRVNEITEMCKAKNEFLITPMECASVKATEVIRVWADLGTITVGEPYPLAKNEG